MFVHCREKEEGLPVLEKAVDAVGRKDGLLGCSAVSMITPN